MTKMMQMNADLMSASAMQAAFDQTHFAAGAEHAIFGLCAAPARDSHRHSLSMSRMASDFRFDRARTSAHLSRNEREINFLHASRCKLGRQIAVRLIILRHDHAAARIFIETMHDAGTFLATDSGKLRAMME